NRAARACRAGGERCDHGNARLGGRQASRRAGRLRAHLAGVRALSDSILVVGAGAWGTALAAHLSRRDDLAVTLYARDEAQAADIVRHGSNEKYLPGIALPRSLVVTASLAAA